jgi:hypothetical protein
MIESGMSAWQALTSGGDVGYSAPMNAFCRAYYYYPISRSHGVHSPASICR